MPTWFAPLLDWTARVFGDDVAARVFAPLIADWQHDAASAATRTRRLLAFSRGVWSLARTSAAVSTTLAVRGLATTAPRMAGTLAIFTVGGTVLLLSLTAYQWVRHGFFDGRMLATLLPSSVVLAVTCAVLPAALLVAATRDLDAPRSRHGLAAVTTLLTAALFVGSGWVVPLSNRSWQHAVAARVRRPVPPPGLRERSLTELVVSPGSAPTAAVRHEIRSRVVIPLLWPAAVSFLGWRLGRRMTVASPSRIFIAWLTGTGTMVTLAFASLAGFRFEDVDLICASLWLLAALAARPRGAETRGTCDATH